MKWFQKIQRLRLRMRYSQAELAVAIGLQQSRIGRWEKGQGMPTMDQGFRLARALGISYDYLMDDAQDEPPPPAVTADEAMILDMVRTVGLNEAKRRLLSAPSAPPASAPDYGRVAAEHDLTLSTRNRLRQAKRPPRSRGPKPDAKGKDKGTDSASPPRRRR
jgi:transcriptional regulator with XRE-family HTH domain